MRTVEAFLDEAIVDLTLAEDRARLFRYRDEDLAKMKLLRHHVWKLKQAIIERKLAQEGVIVTTPLSGGHS